MDIYNAVIVSTYLGAGEDSHGIFTCMLHLNYGGYGQSFGSWNLSCDGFCSRYLQGLLAAVGVESYEELAGKYVRIECTTTIKRIGHIIEDKWFDPEQIKEASNAANS